MRSTRSFGVLSALLVAACLVVLTSVPAAAGRRMPDRDASLILPQGMAVSVDRATFFDDGGLMAMRLRNGHYEVARARVRVVVFDERQRLKGSVSYCTGIIQPGTRQPLVIPLEVKGASTHDQFSVYVEEVVLPRRAITLREPLAAALVQVRKGADLRGWSLSTVETPRTGEIPECPCECEAAELYASEGCGQSGPQAFTCTPMAPGCSQGFTCKR